MVQNTYYFSRENAIHFREKCFFLKDIKTKRLIISLFWWNIHVLRKYFPWICNLSVISPYFVHNIRPILRESVSPWLSIFCQPPNTKHRETYKTIHVCIFHNYSKYIVWNHACTGVAKTDWTGDNYYVNNVWKICVLCWQAPFSRR